MREILHMNGLAPRQTVEAPHGESLAPGRARLLREALDFRHWHEAVLGHGQAGAARLEAERQAYMDRLFQDTVGFSAAKIIRRILGLAHNIDFEWIEDPRLRATCEARSLRLARAMMVDAPSFRTIGDVTKAAKALRDWQPDFGG